MSNEAQNPSSTSIQMTEEDSKTLDGQELKELVQAALIWLRTNQQTVNTLNVFPVPDGDTGTNMLLTMQAACNEIDNSGERNIGKVAHAIAQGALMGARGNSGVILSQLWRGFARSLDDHETMDAALVVRAMHEARNTAYKGVVRPVEGTILTVATDIAKSVEQSVKKTDNLKIILEEMVEAANISVQNTPDLLPILKQAGVVDAGGKGLYFLLEGMLRYLNKQSLDSPEIIIQPLSLINLEETMESIEPGQDFEIVLDFQPFQPLDLPKFYSDLEQMGTSIQLGEGEGIYRMHIHVPTDKFFDPISYIREMGTITQGTIENLVAQMGNVEDSLAGRQSNISIQPDQIATIVVSPGAGISRIFTSLGATAIVEGGQTMNPSTEEILKAFENLPTNKVIILPNNKNIILAADTAASMTVKEVKVVRSTTVPQGLSAMFRLDLNGGLEEVAEEMSEALSEVETGEITIATRSVEINGISVKEGEVIALHNGSLVYSSHNLDDTCLTFLKKADVDSKERITLFYGNNIAKPEVNRLVDKIRSQYPSHEIELHEGGQPHYQFIIAVE